MIRVEVKEIDYEKLEEVFVLVTLKNGHREYEFSYKEEELMARLEDIVLTSNDDMIWRDSGDCDITEKPGIYDSSNYELKFTDGDTSFEYGGTYYYVTDANSELDKLTPESAAKFLDLVEAELHEKFTKELD